MLSSCILWSLLLSMTLVGAGTVPNIWYVLLNHFIRRLITVKGLMRLLWQIYGDRVIMLSKSQEIWYPAWFPLAGVLFLALSRRAPHQLSILQRPRRPHLWVRQPLQAQVLPTQQIYHPVACRQIWPSCHLQAEEELHRILQVASFISVPLLLS